ncbi:MAG: MaoC family dehydratase [Lachnospiraceae bacterium]|nr:MaoC family dehydratase [Lachnospiraceae bacterium]
MNRYTYEEIEQGMSASFEVTVTEEMQENFRKTTGDENPLHISADYARSRGYKDRVVYGMLTSSFYSTLAGMYLPGERALVHSIEAKYQKPVFIGDRLTVEGKVDEKNDTYRLIKIKAVMRNQDGEKVSKAVIQVGVD